MKNAKNIFYLLLFLCMSLSYAACSSDDETETPEPPVPPVIPPPPGELSSEKEITSFIFPANLNELSKDMVGVIDGNTIRFETKEWIENIGALIPVFVGKGTAQVEKTKQISGETANDFRRKVEYIVVAEDESEIKYTVIIKSPQATGLPVIKIDTENGAAITDKENYITAAIKLIDVNNKENDIDSETGIRGRGNSTWGYPKKPYRLKFDKKTSMFGLGKAKSWVLLANYLDPTLIMNTVAFELGHRAGLQYTNHANHVELFLNGKYKGSYVLTEQVQVNEHRVNVDENTGFLVELDTYFDEEYKFKTDIIRLPVMVKSPELDNETGMDFIKKVWKDLEDELFDTSKGFPNSKYGDLVDVDALINYMIVNEVVCNIELKHPKSVYAYKEANSKIFFGPLWDFDWAFGYREDGSFTYFLEPERILRKPNYTGSETGNKFFGRFLDDPAFRTKYKKRWNELYTSNALDFESFIDQKATYLENSQIENFEVWNNELVYKEQIAKMKDWWKKRIAYLNKEINKY